MPLPHYVPVLDSKIHCGWPILCASFLHDIGKHYRGLDTWSLELSSRCGWTFLDVISATSQLSMIFFPGEWKSGLGNLSLSTRPPKPDGNGASSPVPSKDRIPNSKRPARVLFVPSRQQSAASLASLAPDDNSSEASPEQAALPSPPKATAATPDLESSMPSRALQPSVATKSESQRPRPPARSQLAKLIKQVRDAGLGDA